MNMKLNSSCVEIVPDGNCLFRAMSFFVEGNQEVHNKYRQRVVQYLRQNRKDYQCIFETEEELQDYISVISRDHAWGGELELSILSKLYKCAFVIHANGRPEITVILFLYNTHQQVDSLEEEENKNTYHLAYHLNVSINFNHQFCCLLSQRYLH